MRSAPTAGSYRRLRAPGQASGLMGTGMPDTRYAHGRDVKVACQVLGEDPSEVVIAPSFVSHVELQWRRRAGPRCRVAWPNRRGCWPGQGMPDRVAGAPTLEERSDDIRAVMDVAASQRAALAGCAALAGRVALIYRSKVCSLRAIAGSSSASAICSACAIPRGRPARTHIE